VGIYLGLEARLGAHPLFCFIGKPAAPLRNSPPDMVNTRERSQGRNIKGARFPAACHGSTILLRIAYRTSAAEDERLSLRMTAARCVSTVFRLMLNNLAMALLL